MTGELKGFAGFPCLIFSASRPLDKDREAVSGELRAFLRRWESHGVPVQGGFEVLEDRFVIVAHRPAEISGCGRDDLVFFMRDLGARLGLGWLSAARVFYRAGDGRVMDVDRPEFKRLAREGVVTPDTQVFDTTLRDVDSILQGGFVLPASKSWHARLMEPAAELR